MEVCVLFTVLWAFHVRSLVLSPFSRHQHANRNKGVAARRLLVRGVVQSTVRGNSEYRCQIRCSPARSCGLGDKFLA